MIFLTTIYSGILTPLYRLVITLTTLAGTTLADFFHRSLGIGYLGGSLSLFSLVLITLALWFRSMGSIKIKPLTQERNIIVGGKPMTFYLNHLRH